MHSLSGKVAVVTGATGGIGRATAIALASAGATVVAAGRRDAEGEETVRLAHDAGAEACFVRTDVSSEEDVARLINLAVERYGGLHCAVNNAGIDLNAGITDATEEQFDKLVSTNLRGVWLCLRHELRHMRGAGGGAIVNVNSVSGARPTDAQAIYGMTKRGVTHLTQSAAREAGKDGVRVNEILPALLMTEMVRDYFEGPHAIPLEPVVARLALPRAGEPEDGATRSSSSAPTRRATSPAPACPSTAASCSTTPARRDRGPPPEQWQPSRTYSAATPLQESLSTSGFNAGSPPV